MNKIEEQLQTRFSRLIDSVKAKRLFAGYGVFQDNVMFLLYQGDKYYLRAHKELVKDLENLGAARHADIEVRMSPQLMLYHYYQLPLSISNNDELLKPLVLRSIDEAKEQKLITELAKKNRIKELINLSIKHERLLAKVGIYTVEELRTIGADNAYVRLKKLGIPLGSDFFLSLHSGLKNRNVYTLTEGEKRKILTALNLVLDENGLRKIKL